MANILFPPDGGQIRMQIHSFSVQNYRGFKDRTTLRIKPITVLLGRNSSGKSSLTRLIPLLQQSAERKGSSPILWHSDPVDFGSIREVVNHNASNDELRIGVSITSNEMNEFLIRSKRHYYYDRFSKEDDIKIEYVMRLRADNNRTKFIGIEIAVSEIGGSQEQRLVVDWGDEGVVTGFAVNGRHYDVGSEIYSVDLNSMFPIIVRQIEDGREIGSYYYPLFYPSLRSAISQVIHGRTSKDKVDYGSSMFTYCPEWDVEDRLKIIAYTVQGKINKTVSCRISDFSMINDLPLLVRFIASEVMPAIREAAYIGPARVSSKRFDRIEELAVSRLDAMGENTAMYIYSLNDTERESFNDLFLRACGHEIQVEDSGPGHVSIKIGRPGQREFENIADVGFGFSQLIPVVAQLHAVKERRAIANVTRGANAALFAVEQPELHLHPAMQANLADLFVGAIKSADGHSSSLNIIVETHSETLVSQLGLLVAEGKLDSNDVILYFVEKVEETGVSYIKDMSFDTSGVINDWPIGFFSAR